MSGRIFICLNACTSSDIEPFFNWTLWYFYWGALIKGFYMKLRRGQILYLPVLLYNLTIFIDFRVTFQQPPHSLNVNVNVSLNTRYSTGECWSTGKHALSYTWFIAQLRATSVFFHFSLSSAKKQYFTLFIRCS